jgi:hypothetical protein
MRVVSLFLILPFLLSSCWSAGEDVSGVWQLPEESAKVTFNIFDPPFDGRVKLAVDQFGSDVAGVMLFYADDYMHDLRHCLYLEDGEVKQGRFLFSATLADDAHLEGSFAVVQGSDPDLLEGALYLSEEGGASVSLTLEFIDDEKLLKVEGWDHGCPSK